MFVKESKIFLEKIKCPYLLSQKLSCLTCGIWILWDQFFSSFNNKYILEVVDYVSKWVDVIVSPTSDTKVVLRCLKKNIFSRFGIPRVVVSDEEKYFIISNLISYCSSMVVGTRLYFNTILKSTDKRNQQIMKSDSFWRK